MVYDNFMFKRFISGQSGFSLIQGMMLATAVAGMAYVGTKLTTDQKLAQKGADSKGRVEQLHSMIYSILQNKDHCTATLNYIGTKTPGTTQFLRPINLNTGAMPFQVNVEKKFGTGNSNPNYLYMNGAVSIDDMQVTFPPTFDQHANLKITYGKIDSKSTESRSGKGYGSTTYAKNIKLKIQSTSAGVYESCYAVDEAQNQDMVKDFCDRLGQTDTNNLFSWDPVRQKCVLNETKCPYGQVFTGFDSNGKPRCAPILNWMNFNDLIDTTSETNCNVSTSNDVRFVSVAGNKVQIQCRASCTTSCDCAGGPGMNCESGVCVDRGMSGTGCINGTYGKGDASCRFICSGGMWACGMAPPTGQPICGCKNNCGEAGYGCFYASNDPSVLHTFTACDGSTKYCGSSGPVNPIPYGCTF